MSPLSRLALLVVLLHSGCRSAEAPTPGPAPSAPPEAQAAPEPEPSEPAPVPPSANVERARKALRARDYGAARTLFAAACDEDNDVAACFQLAQLLDSGRGGPADPDRAHELLVRACASDLQQACDQLGH